MTRRPAAALVFALLLSPASAPHDGRGAQAAEAAPPAPVVVELFTSQSCYSCPPAEALLVELADRADVLALEFHVDYWDSLVYGAAGRWKDVFSSPAHTERQREYNRAIRGTGNVYTPQMVIAGRFEAVGSNGRAVEQALRAARAAQRPPLRVGFAEGRVAIAGDAMVPAGVWYVRFVARHATEVRAGENKGKTLVNAHAVVEMRRLGDWTGRPFDTALPPPPAAGEGCAVLVQPEPLGPVLGAALCPRPEA